MTPSTTFVEVLARHAATNPRALAFGWLDGEPADGHTAVYDYAALHARTQAVAAALRARVTPGARALLIHPPGLPFVPALLGCFAAGVVAVPLPTPRSARALARLAAVAADARAEVALTTVAGLERLPRPLPPGLDGLTWLATDDLPAAGDPVGTPEVSPDRVALLQYTSGSTGTPKGVVLHQTHLVTNAAAIARAFEVSPASVSVSWLPFHHDMGLVGGVLTPLLAGMPMTLFAPASFVQRPARWVEAVSRFGATFSGGPSFAYDLCARRTPPARCRDLDLSRWTVAFCGAEPVRAEALESFAAAFAPAGFRPDALFPCYGLAEATLAVTGGPVGRGLLARTVSAGALERGRATPPASDERARRLVSCGSALAGTRVRIVDPDACAPRGPDEVGEVWVQSPSVAAGYFHQDAATEAAFRGVAHGLEGTWLRTGDLGLLDAQGELFVTGRKKDLVIIRGQNIYPDDVEHTAQSSHPALVTGGGAAFHVDGPEGERLVLVQEAARGAGPDALAAALTAARLAVTQAHEVVPQAMLLVREGSVPRTTSGKVRRSDTRARYLAGELRPLAEWRPAEPPPDPAIDSPAPLARPADARAIADWLAEAAARVLELSPAEVDRSRPFADLGLDSIQVIDLGRGLESWLGRAVPDQWIWERPTITLLAERLAQPESSHVAATLFTRDVARADARDRRPEVDEDDRAVAIIGIGCRLPGADSPDALWDLLARGGDAVREVPADRWDVDAFFDQVPGTPGKMSTRWGGFLDGVDRFAASFFGISAREAASLDPQQRLLIETTWRALEHAGLPPDSLAGASAGVFVGISSSDYSRFLLGHPERVDAWSGTGNAHSVAANRLSYLLDLRGPSLAVDTACSSSLVAVHLAVQSLRRGESALALAAGVNVILSPELTIAFSHARMMAADGRCKTFDHRADGYVRSEGCGVVVLKRLADARRDGDRVLAVIRGSAMNQDGQSNGLTAPSGPAQEAVIRAAHVDAGLTPDAIGYVEAHGTGTRLGDPIEVTALRNVWRGTHGRCALGSVKTNLGHLEAAAGIAGLIKATLALERGELPPTVHFTRPNPALRLQDGPFDVVTARAAWTGWPRCAGVSAFGFGGTNAHVVLEAAPNTKSIEKEPRNPGEQEPGSLPGPPFLGSWVPSQPILRVPESDSRAHALIVSAKTPDDLARAADDLAAFLDTSTLALGDVAHTANAGRTHFAHRLAVVGRTPSEVAARLRARTGRGAHVGRAPAQRPKVAFLFAGQGLHRAGAGAALDRDQPAFRRALDRCAQVLEDGRLLDRPLRSLLFPAAGEPRDLLDRTGYAQPALFALEWALSELWRAWGVVPDAVLGHSVGEYVAAVVAGALSLEDGLRLVARRGALMQALPTGGGMAAVRGAPAITLAALEHADVRGRVEVAAWNAPEQVVVSGDDDALERVLALVGERGLRGKRLPVSHAFHSARVEPALAALEAEARALTHARPAITLVSNVTGRALGSDETLDAAYWRLHARSPVQFARGVVSLVESGHGLFVELGPGRGLLSLAGECLPAGSAPLIPTLSSDDERGAALEALARLHAHGVAARWDAVDRHVARRRVTLPGYPLARERHWVGPVREAVPSGPALERPVHLLALSAPTEDALEARARALASALAAAPTLSVADAAFTVNANADAAPFRAAVRAATRDELVRGLEALARGARELPRGVTRGISSLRPKVAFVFTGQGAQIPGMARPLYDAHPGFRRTIDEGIVAAERAGLKGVREDLLRPEPEREPRLDEAWRTFPALLVFEVALARLWVAWGVEPDALLGFSASELVAAVLAGVLSLDDALRLVAAKVRLTERMPEGAMAAVATSEAALAPLLAAHGGRVRVGVYMAPELVVITGERVAVDAVVDALRAQDVYCVRWEVSRAFHSPAEDVVASEWARAVEQVTFSAPTRPWISTLTGTLYEHGGADYWVRQVREPTRFLPALEDLLAKGFDVLLEVGPRPNLTKVLRRALPGLEARLLPSITGLARSPEAAWSALLDAAATLHTRGVSLDWAAFDRSYARARVPLPVQTDGVVAPGAVRSISRDELLARVHALRWVPRARSSETSLGRRDWLLLADPGGEAGQAALALAARLASAGAEAQVASVVPAGAAPGAVVDLTALDAPVDELAHTLAAGCARALAALRAPESARLWLVTRGAVSTAGEAPRVAAAARWGLARSLRLEHPERSVTALDLDPTAPLSAAIDALALELLGSEDAGGEPAVAWRDGRRLVLRLGRAEHDPAQHAPRFACRADGTYLVTGGLGALGLRVARWLVSRGARRLVLVGRTGLGGERSLPGVTPIDATSAPDVPARLEAVRLLEAQGATVVVLEADVSDAARLAERLALVRGLLPPLRGVVHCAGVVEPRLAVELDARALERALAAKAAGALALDTLTRDQPLDLFVLFSSVAATWGGRGLAAYAAANATLDALAARRRALGLPALSVAWGPWADGGMADDEDRASALARAGLRPLPPEHALAALGYLLSTEPGAQRVVVDADWSTLSTVVAPLLDDGADATPSAASDTAHVLALPAEERAAAVVDVLLTEVARVTGAPVEPHQPLGTVGLDSLMALELRAAVEKRLGVQLPLARLLDGPSVAQLAERLLGSLGAPEGAAPALPVLAPDASARHAPFSLSDIQQAYLLGRGAFFDLGGVAARGLVELEATDLDVPRLEAALRRVVARHDMLRAVVLSPEEQRVIPVGDLPAYGIAVDDLRHLAPEAALARVDAARERMAVAAPPTDRWPLFEVRALHLDARRTRLLVAIDGLLIDGWSFMAIMAEWRRRYEEPAWEPPALTLTFRDYLLALRRLDDHPLTVRAREYWWRRLDDLPPAPDLPLARSLEGLTPAFTNRLTTVDAATWSRLKARAAQAGLTPSAVVCAAFSDVLAAWSKSPKFTINCLYFNRQPLHEQVHEVAGNFSATSLLAVDATGATFEARAKALQARLWEDLQHGHVSGVRVLRELNRRRGPSTRPTFPVVFASTLPLAQARGDASPVAWLGDLVRRTLQTPQVLLDHQAAEVEGALWLSWDTVDAAFPAGLLDDMWGAYVARLARLADDEAAWTSPRLDLLSRAQLATRTRANDTAGPRPTTLLHEPFAARAARAPGALAVVSGDVRLTYGELDRLATRFGHALRARGARPGQLVGVVMEKGWEQVAAVLGVLRSGAAYLPLDAGLPAERLSWVLEHADVSLVLTQPWLVERTWPASVTPLVVERGLAGDDTPLQRVQTQADLAYVIFTSGSTGLPKGVMIDHLGAANTVLDVNARHAIGPTDRVFALSSMSFDLSVWDVFGTLGAGGAVVLPPAGALREPAELVRLATVEGVTVWNSVPAFVDMVVEHARGERVSLPASIRLVLLSGDWIPITLPARLATVLPGARVVSMGGATEASIWSIDFPIPVEGVDPAWTSIPYGRPMRNQTFHVLDEAGEPRPTWVAGELFIGGIGVAKGYWKDEAKTSRSFVEVRGERLYRTGDVGRYLPDGTIELFGREDLQVKVQGHRIELGEVEAALAAAPGVRTAVVLAPGERGKRRLVAYVVPAQGDAPPSTEALREFVAAKLPGYMVPSSFVLLDHLPLTSNAKVDRAALLLRAPETAGPAGDGTPSTAEETRLVEIWQDVLRVRPIGVNDDFFALGGTSLDAVRVLVRAQAAFDRRLPLAALFQARTVAGLAARLAATTPGSAGAALTELSRGERELVLVHPIGGGTACYRDLAAGLGPETGVAAFEARGLDGGAAPREDLSIMARAYVEELVARRPEGPYRLAGWSMGGLIAFEMAALLRARGARVALLAMIDPPRPGDEALVPIDDAAARERVLAIVGRDVEPGALDALARVVRAHSSAMATWRPAPQETDALLLRASDRRASGPWSADALDATWRDLVRGRLDVDVVEGDHDSVVVTPHVTALAARLRAALEAAR